MKKIIISVTILLQISTSFAHDRQSNNLITGHIIDHSTKEHIPFASVAIKGTTIGVTSDYSGHFLLKNVPVGEHTLVATFIGYERMEKTITVQANQTTDVEFLLVPQALELSGIVVTGSRNEVDRRESSTIVNVLSNRLFESTGATCVADVLSFQPGLRVSNTCNNCGTPELRINGLGGQYTQILINNRPMFSALAGVYGLEQFPVGMIERVEIVRGGASALYGPSAIAGVVNIITKDPLRNSISLATNVGIFGESLTDINTVFNGSFVTDNYQTGAHLFAVANNRNPYDHNGDGFSEVHKLRSETFGFRGYHNINHQSRLTLDYHRIGDYRRGGNAFDRPPHEADIAEQTRHQINGGGVQYNYLSKDNKHRFNAYTSAQHIHRESYYGSGQDPDAYGFTKDLMLVAGSQYTHSTDHFLFMPSEFTAGVEYTDNTLKDEMLAYHRVINQRVRNFGGYIQNEWRNERFSLAIGGRLDGYNVRYDKNEYPHTGLVFSPRANARYTINDFIALRAGYAHGFRAPQVFDEDLHVAAVGGEVLLIVVDSDLKRETSNSYNFSIDLNKRFGKIATNLLIDAFYTDLNDVFVLEDETVSGEDNLIFMRTNADGATVQGINFDLNIGFTHKLFANVGFTVQRSRYKEPYEWSDSEFAQPQKEMFRAPNQYGYFTLNYIPVKNLTLSATGTYTGSMWVQHHAGYIETDRNFKAPSFFDAGLRLSYDFQLSKLLKMRVSAGVRNMFNQFQNEIDRGENLDAGFIFGPLMPRMFQVGVRFMM